MINNYFIMYNIILFSTIKNLKKNFIVLFYISIKTLLNNNNNNFMKFSKFHFSSSNDDFPKITKQDFFDEQDLIINLDGPQKYKGLLIICPTPIGNLNDLSIRQYEALKNGDIIASEDT